jgi:hypothetical protein
MDDWANLEPDDPWADMPGLIPNPLWEEDWTSDEEDPETEHTLDTDDIDHEEDPTDDEEPGGYDPDDVTWAERAAGGNPVPFKVPPVKVYKRPSRHMYIRSSTHPCCKDCKGAGQVWKTNYCHCWICDGDNTNCHWCDDGVMSDSNWEWCRHCGTDGIARKYTVMDDDFDHAMDLCDSKSARNGW